MRNTEYPSRISTIFYLGLEGLGGVDLITDEDENVRASDLYLSIAAHNFQGIDGPIEFSGTTPDLDDFTIRIVDGMPFWSAVGIIEAYVLSGATNEAITSGPHSEMFADRLDKSHFVGLRVNPGHIWTAKGRCRPSKSVFFSRILRRFNQSEYCEACRTHCRTISPV